MSVPPTYADLGKSTRDLFAKGYNYGFMQFDLKTKTGCGIEFTTKGSSVNDSRKIFGSLETKYKQPEHSLTFIEKWTTENNLSSEVTVEDKLATGLKLGVCTSYSLHTGKKAGALKSSYKCDHVNANLDSDFNLPQPTVQGSAVLGYEGWLAGCQFAFDSSNSTFTKNNVALGYNGADFQLLTAVNDATDISASIFQTVNNRLATALQFALTVGKTNARFGIATQYKVDADATINVKVNNVGQVGVGYTHKLYEGVKLTLSSLIEAKDLNAGGHKLGFGIEFDV